jgi:hypothetical protein
MMLSELENVQPDGHSLGLLKSTHSTPRSEARGMLRVDTERRFLPGFKNRGLAPSNVSNHPKEDRIWILKSTGRKG